MQLDKAHAAFLNFLGLKLTLTKTWIIFTMYVSFGNLQKENNDYAQEC